LNSKLDKELLLIIDNKTNLPHINELSQKLSQDNCKC